MVHTTHDTDLDALFAPRSIVVVGASNKTGKMGNLFMRRLAAEYQGRLYAVNPNEEQVAGIMTLPSITHIPGPLDLLIALVPAPRLMELVEACQPGQVRYLLAIPSGFAEISIEGRTLQKRLMAAANDRGMRVLGPNIVGIMNGTLGINASMMPELPPGGRGLSCITQSGGFGMALSMYTLDHDVRFAKFCDLGNMSDLEVHEVLNYLANDPDTEVIGLFLESAGDHVAFRQAAERAIAHKSLIVVPVGVSAAGRRASLAHLGIARGVVELNDQWPAGTIVAETGLDLLNAAKALLWQPKAAGNRVAIVTGTGGIGTEIADLVVRTHMEVPEFSAELRAELRQHLPYFAGSANPVDLTPIWGDYAAIYPKVLDAIVASGEVDVVIISVTDVAASVPELAQALANWSRSNRSIPCMVYWGARDRDRENMRAVEAAMLPCYRTTREAVKSTSVLMPRAAAVFPPSEHAADQCGSSI